MIDTRNFPPPTGGPAFPTQRIEVNHKGVVTGFAVMADGMTLRDYFAAKVMQGMLAEDGGGTLENHELAELAYLMADDMLEARK